MPTTRFNQAKPKPKTKSNARRPDPTTQQGQTEAEVEQENPNSDLPNPDASEQQKPKAMGRPRARRVNATALARDSQSLTNDADTFSPQAGNTRPRKRGRGAEATVDGADDNVDDPAPKKAKCKVDDASQPPVKAKATRRQKQTAVVSPRDPLPDRPGRNVHPAKVAKPTTIRRTSQEVTAEREAKKRAIEEKIREGEKAKELLALMNTNEDHDDDELLTKNPQRLSAAIRKRGREYQDDTSEESGEEEFDFEEVENAVYSDESSVAPAKVNKKVHVCLFAHEAIAD